MSEQREVWAKRVREWKASGQNAREYCASQGYSIEALYTWSSRLRREEGVPGPAPMKVARVVRVHSSRSIEVTRVRLEVDGMHDAVELMRELFAEGRR